MIVAHNGLRLSAFGNHLHLAAGVPVVYDGAKKISGRKRHRLVDTIGLLIN